MVHYARTDKQHKWPVYSQHPEAATKEYRQRAEYHFLPVLLSVWQLVEKVTGHRWQSTSYWRKSPSHRRGEALDIAPEFTASAKQHYAVYRGSDPVLYKRGVLMRQLQQVAASFRHPLYDVGIYVEPDHLHIQLMKRKGGTPTRVFKWKQPKPVYGDTLERLKLPMLN